MFHLKQGMRRAATVGAIGLLSATALAVGGMGFFGADAASSAPACTGATGDASAGARATPPGATPAASVTPPGGANGGLVDGLVRGATGAVAGLGGNPLGGGSQLPTGTLPTGVIQQVLAALDAQLNGLHAPAVPAPSSGGSGGSSGGSQLFVGATGSSSRTGASIAPEPTSSNATTPPTVTAVGLPILGAS